MKTTSLIATIALVASGVSAGPIRRGSSAASHEEYDNGNMHHSDEMDQYDFTSSFSVTATPDQVVNGTMLTGGLAGALGHYNFWIDSVKDVICYDISITGFQGEYQSPAKTATHIHNGAVGVAGPPRLAFPNPVAVDAAYPEGERISKGCLVGPFTTGVVTNGADTGAGFMVSMIEDNPSAYYADIHSSVAVPGVARGQVN